MEQIGQWTQNWATNANLTAHYFPSTNSTNTQARKIESSDGSPAIFVTESQTEGRGRNNHAWVSPEPGTALLASWSVTLSAPPQPITSPLVGLALYKSLKETWPQLPLAIKPPNDIFCQDKKVAGLLIESISAADKHQLVVGIGINVNSNPKIDQSGALCEFLQTPITEESWNGFLNSLLIHLTEAWDQCTLSQITPPVSHELEMALNNLPHLQEKYSDVLPDGSLKQGEHLISWSTL